MRTSNKNREASWISEFKRKNKINQVGKSQEEGES